MQQPQLPSGGQGRNHDRPVRTGRHMQRATTNLLFGQQRGQTPLLSCIFKITHFFSVEVQLFRSAEEHGGGQGWGQGRRLTLLRVTPKSLVFHFPHRSQGARSRAPECNLHLSLRLQTRFISREPKVKRQKDFLACYCWRNTHTHTHAHTHTLPVNRVIFSSNLHCFVVTPGSHIPLVDCVRCYCSSSGLFLIRVSTESNLDTGDHTSRLMKDFGEKRHSVVPPGFSSRGSVWLAREPRWDFLNLPCVSLSKEKELPQRLKDEIIRRNFQQWSVLARNCLSARGMFRHRKEKLVAHFCPTETKTKVGSQIAGTKNIYKEPPCHCTALRLNAPVLKSKQRLRYTEVLTIALFCNTELVRYLRGVSRWLLENYSTITLVLYDRYLTHPHTPFWMQLTPQQGFVPSRTVCSDSFNICDLRRAFPFLSVFGVFGAPLSDSLLKKYPFFRRIFPWRKFGFDAQPCDQKMEIYPPGQLVTLLVKRASGQAHDGCVTRCSEPMGGLRLL